MTDTIYTKPALLITDNKEEVVGLRTLTSKTFMLDNGEFEIHDGGIPVHYFNGGKWEEIDLNIEVVNGKNVIHKAPYQAEIFTDKIGYSFSSPELNYEMVLVKIGEHDVDNSRFVCYSDGHQQFWNNAAEGINVKVQCYADKVEAFIEIENATAARSFTWKIIDAGNHVFTTMGGDMNQDALEVIASRTEKINNEYFFTETWTGRVSRISDPKTRIKKWFDDAVFPVVIDPTVTINIANDDDDGYQAGTVFYINLPKILKNSSVSNQAGFRFQNVNVPVGATINTAKLKIFNDNVVGTVTGKVWGDKVANAAAWSSLSRPTQITKTVASTNITPSAGVNSINVTNQISEIIGLGGWASNNAIRLGILTISRTATGTTPQYASMADFGSVNAAQLIINYTGVTPPATTKSRNIFNILTPLK